MDLLDIQRCDTVAFEKFVLQVQCLVGMLMKLGCKIREEKDKRESRKNVSDSSGNKNEKLWRKNQVRIKRKEAEQERDE